MVPPQFKKKKKKAVLGCIFFFFWSPHSSVPPHFFFFALGSPILHPESVPESHKYQIGLPQPLGGRSPSRALNLMALFGDESY
jgi:hypothetical protein